MMSWGWKDGLVEQSCHGLGAEDEVAGGAFPWSCVWSFYFFSIPHQFVEVIDFLSSAFLCTKYKYSEMDYTYIPVVLKKSSM